MTIRELLDSNTNSFSHLVVKSTEGDVLYDGPCADFLTKISFLDCEISVWEITKCHRVVFSFDLLIVLEGVYSF